MLVSRLRESNDSMFDASQRCVPFNHIWRVFSIVATQSHPASGGGAVTTHFHFEWRAMFVFRDKNRRNCFHIHHFIHSMALDRTVKPFVYVLCKSTAETQWIACCAKMSLLCMVCVVHVFAVRSHKNDGKTNQILQKPSESESHPHSKMSHFS